MFPILLIVLFLSMQIKWRKVFDMLNGASLIGEKDYYESICNHSICRYMVSVDWTVAWSRLYGVDFARQSCTKDRHWVTLISSAWDIDQESQFREYTNRDNAYHSHTIEHECSRTCAALKFKVWINLTHIS